MSLKEYNSKRDFQKTKEPKGLPDKANRHRFVIQRHEASRLHFDFRLEMDGVLRSWAVPKGPSMNSKDRRFAVQTEDHPVAYLKFKGNIPPGEYGGGHMTIWDTGHYLPVDQDMNPLTDAQARSWLKKGEFKIFLKGKKIQGGFVLIRLKNDERNWLLIKHNDEWNQQEEFDIDRFSGEAAKKTVVKKTSVKKSAPKKTALKKTALKKTAVKKTGVKSAMKEVSPKKSSVKRAANKKIAKKKFAKKKSLKDA